MVPEQGFGRTFEIVLFCYACGYPTGNRGWLSRRQSLPNGKIPFQGASLVKLILRNKEYEVKPGMTLLSALQKINVLPESVIATREGEMILDDEILKDGEVIKLVAVISGG